MGDVSWHRMLIPTMAPLEVVIRATITFFFVQVALRFARRRELSRLATYDLAVVFLFAVAVRTTIVGDDTSVTTGFLGLGVLFGWNWLFSWLSLRWPALNHLLSGKPTRLMHNGQIDERVLRRHRLREEELLSGLREKHGLDDLKYVKDAFIGADGKIAYVLRHRPEQR